MAVFYLPPADIDDYRQHEATRDALAQDWHDFIANRIGRRNSGLFYDAFTDVSPGQPSAPQPISWNGFPRSIWEWFNADSDPAGPEQALAAAEVLRPTMFFISPDGVFQSTEPERLGSPMRRVINGQLGDPVFVEHRQQDEYCEWHVDRDQDRRITRISFTAEGPEYWQRMAEIDFDLVLDLYQTYVSREVKAADLKWPFGVAIPNFQAQQYELLFEEGAYNPYNVWNTRSGAMHLTHPSNTLGAEINLAADGTILRPSVPLEPADSFPVRLVCCGIPAGVNRSSDPRIAAKVNGFAQQGTAVTLANPVGLYMSTIDVDGLRDPQGVPVGNACLSVPRASANGVMKLRAVVQPPDGATFTLDQCTLGGNALTGGGRIAKQITMVLFGQAKAIPGRVGETVDCETKCCRKPDAPNVHLVVAPGQNCGQLSAEAFDGEKPYLPSPGGVLPAAERLVAEPRMAWRRRPVDAIERTRRAGAGWPPGSR
jgi:hypothetical protein